MQTIFYHFLSTGLTGDVSANEPDPKEMKLRELLNREKATYVLFKSIISNPAAILPHFFIYLFERRRNFLSILKYLYHDRKGSFCVKYDNHIQLVFNYYTYANIMYIGHIN